MIAALTKKSLAGGVKTGDFLYVTGVTGVREGWMSSVSSLKSLEFMYNKLFSDSFLKNEMNLLSERILKFCVRNSIIFLSYK